MPKKMLCINLLFVVFIICLCGCDSDKEKSNYNENTTNNNQNTYIINEIENLDYNYGDNGLYYFTGYDNTVYTCGELGNSGDYMLYVADLESGVQVPLCNKAECEHKNAKCNACICVSPERIVGIKVKDDGIYVVKNPFMIGIGESGIYLEKISFDGTSRKDLGYILKYEVSNLGMSWHQSPLQMDEEYIYFMPIMTETKVNEDSTIEERRLKIYRYKLDGTEESELILDEIISEGMDYVAQYNILDDYLYYNNKKESKRINLNTLNTEVITQDMFFVSKYNNEGKILACDTKNEEVDYYVYDKNMNTRYSLLESGLKEEYIDLLKKTDIDSLKYYIDDKYIYIYEPSQINGTLIFDHEFKYLGLTDMKVQATIGDNLIGIDSESFVSLKREDIFEKDAEKFTLIVETKRFEYEWNTYLEN